MNQYLALELLALDGAFCDGMTKGVLGRAEIVARDLIPAEKETDRHWEQGEDPSMLDPASEIREDWQIGCNRLNEKEKSGKTWLSKVNANHEAHAKSYHGNSFGQRRAEAR